MTAPPAEPGTSEECEPLKYGELRPDWRDRISGYALLAVTTFATYLDHFEDDGVIDYSIANPCSSVDLVDGFTFYGYDTICRGGISGLMNCGSWIGEEAESIRFKASMNEYGLLTDHKTANEICELANYRIS